MNIAGPIQRYGFGYWLQMSHRKYHLNLRESSRITGQKPSENEERYWPQAAIKALSTAEYAVTTRAKRKAKSRVNRSPNSPRAS